MATTLTWESNFEWEHDDVRERTGVVTKNYGPRSRHNIRLGIDPSYNAPSRATHYFPLEEDSTSTTTTEDVISGADAFWEGNPQQAPQGALGSNAPEFSPGGEIQAVNFSDNAQFDHGGEFSLAVFFETNDDRNLRTLFHTARPFDSEGGILISKNEGPRIGVSIYANGSWHTQDDFFLGDMELGVPYLLLVRLREINGEWRLGVQLAGFQEQERTYNFERPALSPDNNFGALGSLWYADVRDMGGTFDEMVYWDYGISDVEMREMRRAFAIGWLRTRWLPADGMATELRINHEMPTDTQTHVVIVQDVTGDGSFDNSQTVPLEPNIGFYELDQFDDEPSNYSLEFVLETDDPYETPIIDVGRLTIEQIPPSGVWATGSDGVVDTDASDGVILTE